MSQGGSHRSGHDTGARRPVSEWRLLGARGLVALSGVVVVALGLAACNGAQAEPEPDPLDTIEVDAEPEPDPEPEAEGPGPEEYEHPEPGPDIDDEGQAGAEAAAVYFVELYSYIHATGDFEEWEKLSRDNCNFCAGVRDGIQEIYDAGGYIVTSAPTIVDVSSQVWPQEDGDFAVAVVSDVAGFEDYDATGELTADYPAESVRVWVLLEFTPGEWQVAGIEVEGLE